MPKKNILFVGNLLAGQKRLGKKLPDVISVLCKHDFLPTVCVTQYAGHARELVLELASGYDMVICAGGDGTLSETISGLLDAQLELPVGYIPCGTTNDLASTLGLAKEPEKAAEDIALGKPISIDIGRFNKHTFAYTASFGAFTRASYATSQSMKNTFGHLAYVLEGLKDLAYLQPINAHVRTETEEFDGSYVFGAVSNTTSLAGILTFDKERVMLDDGKFEVMLIDAPKNALDLSQLLINLSQKKYEPPIHMFSASSVEIETQQPVNWTLDGEFQKGDTRIEIKNIPSAVRIIVPAKKEEGQVKPV